MHALYYNIIIVWMIYKLPYIAITLFCQSCAEIQDDIYGTPPTQCHEHCNIFYFINNSIYN